MAPPVTSSGCQAAEAPRRRGSPAGRLLLLTVAALAVHGYHPAIEDAEIYLPGIKLHLNPALYPTGREFFLSHASMTWFDDIVAASVRWSHLPFDAVLFCWHLASIFLLLLASWRLGEACFETRRACWCGTALVASLLTMPVAGTALFIMDPYLTPRSVSLYATLFALRGAIDRKRLQVAGWMAITAAFHPLMTVFAGSYLTLVYFQNHERRPIGVLPAAFGLVNWVPRASASYHIVVQTNPYFFILRWAWYEWAGVFGSIALACWFERIGARHGRRTVQILCRAIVAMIVIALAAALLLTVPDRFEALARYQPMRALYVAYVLLLIIGGGLMGDGVLKQSAVRWALLFLPLSVGVGYAQTLMYPATRHIEWPLAPSHNAWVDAFQWIEASTPIDATFALDPEYMVRPGEDRHGFRAIAERSRLADALKDSSAATMFPEGPLAEHVLQQVNGLRGWRNLGISDFARIGRAYGVSWVVLEQPGVAGLYCPYANAAVRVCQVTPFPDHLGGVRPEER
jgi:hypothetical protein